MNRYELEGDAAEPRSRRPHTSPTRLPQATIDLIIELREKLAGIHSPPPARGPRRALRPPKEKARTLK
jgi:hypothetical protein